MRKVVIFSTVRISESKSQCSSGLVWKDSGANREKGIEGGCGQDVTTVACRGRDDGGNRLGRGCQRNGLHDHLFDFRLILCKFFSGTGLCNSRTYLESEH